MPAVAEDACHELLLRLAGRLPDRSLWRFRDWLAAGGLPAIAQALPLTLLRQRIALTGDEIGTLTDVLLPVGGDGGQLTAIPEVTEVSDPGYEFTLRPPDELVSGDSVAVVLDAVVAGRPEVRGLRVCWRYGAAAKRVVLVRCEDHPARLAGELQRVLRALGDPEPAVEAIPPGLALAPYHHAALAVTGFEQLLGA